MRLTPFHPLAPRPHAPTSPQQERGELLYPCDTRQSDPSWRTRRAAPFCRASDVALVLSHPSWCMRHVAPSSCTRGVEFVTLHPLRCASDAASDVCRPTCSARLGAPFGSHPVCCGRHLAPVILRPAYSTCRAAPTCCARHVTPVTITAQEIRCKYEFQPGSKGVNGRRTPGDLARLNPSSHRRLPRAAPTSPGTRNST